RLEEPDVDHRGRQLDVPHPLAADPRVGHLDTAAVAHHALVFHAPVLAAGALPVLFRAEDALAEQTVLLGAVGAVVDGCGLLDLAERPRADVVRAREADPHAAIVIDAVVVDLAGAHVPPSILKYQGPRTKDKKKAKSSPCLLSSLFFSPLSLV